MKKKETGTGNAEEQPAAGQARTGLSRQLIVRTALGIVDREGLEALSMRRLGAELKVDPMAVYYHIHNKAALLDGLVEAVMSEIDLTQDDPALPIDERLHLAFSVYRETLLAHPRALPVMSARPLNTPVALRPADFAVGVFSEAGFSASEALAAVSIIAAYVRGSATITAAHMAGSELHQPAGSTPEELMKGMTEEEFPHLWACLKDGCTYGVKGEFELGLKALIRGLMVLHGEQAEADQSKS